MRSSGMEEGSLGIEMGMGGLSLALNRRLYENWAVRDL